MNLPATMKVGVLFSCLLMAASLLASPRVSPDSSVKPVKSQPIAFGKNVAPIPGAAPRGDRALRNPQPSSTIAKEPVFANPVAIRVEPAEVPLYGTRAEGRVIVTGVRGDGSREDLTRTAVFTSLDSKVVAAGDDRVLRPVSDGEATVKVAYGTLSSLVKVRVRDTAKRKPVEFAREIVPILTHAGCNQGSCHGSQYGKGGFKLSLSGFEPDIDYTAIVKQAGGRRISTTDAARSLVLLKPTLVLPHQGGRRLEPGSDDYKLLVQWLQDGAPGVAPKDPEVTKIQVYPTERVLEPGKQQSLAVYATYSDGVVRDVTRWARLNVLNDGIAAVSPDAVVKTIGHGATAVMIRFGGQATVSQVTAPYARIAKYPQIPAGNYVDELVGKRWKALGLLPSVSCDDSTFVRRVYLDVIGTPPTVDEVKAFLTDTSPDKRTKLVDAVLNRPEYADYWALKWGDLLRSERNRLGPKGMWSFTNWIRTNFRDNRPLDQFCRELITAQGSTFTDGPTNYYRVVSSPPDLAETTSQVFLGMRMQCTRCHHHPFEKWSQADYYQFAAFFARVGLKGSDEFGIFGQEQVVRVNNGGDVYHPKTNQLMKPTPLGGYPTAMKVHAPKTADLIDPDADAGGDRRALLAEWITKDNPLFARNIVNRYWGYLMGRGLVEPIDDQRVTNPPTNPELLDQLAKDFMAHAYDVKHLIRTICSSRAYQLSSDVTPANKADTAYYSHYFIKRLPAEVMLDTINMATGTTEKFGGLPNGFRAIQLPDPRVDSYFLDAFGRAPRVIACECERAAEPNMGQALHLMMSDLVNRKVQDGNGTLNKLIQAKKSDREIIETCYMTALGRPPKPDEMAKAEKTVRELIERPAVTPKDPNPLVPVQIQMPRAQYAKDQDRKVVLEDILWALLNSKEFIFNH